MVLMITGNHYSRFKPRLMDFCDFSFNLMEGVCIQLEKFIVRSNKCAMYRNETILLL